MGVTLPGVTWILRLYDKQCANSFFSDSPRIEGFIGSAVSPNSPYTVG